MTTSARNAYHTIGVRTTGTVLDGTLSCTVTASDGDLYLQVFKSNAWRNVASALGLTCVEAIRYTVPASNSGLQFRYRVYLYTGTNTAYLLRSCP